VGAVPLRLRQVGAEQEPEHQSDHRDHEEPDDAEQAADHQ
jgi:hypothetical protein